MWHNRGARDDRQMTDRRILLAEAACLVAAVVGLIHGMVSVYWGVGGELLLGTIGDIADRFADLRWVLIIVGVVKIVAALVPLIVVRQRGRLGRWRLPVAVGAVVLVIYGLLNTVTASLLWTRVLPRPGDYDEVATLGHALLWDPLFALWGAALLVAVVTGRVRLSA